MPASLFFPSGFGRLKRPKPEGKNEGIILGPQPRAALRLPWAIMSSSLQDFGLARSARIGGECHVEPRLPPSTLESP